MSINSGLPSAIHDLHLATPNESSMLDQEDSKRVLNSAVVNVNGENYFESNPTETDELE